MSQSESENPKPLVEPVMNPKHYQYFLHGISLIILLGFVPSYLIQFTTLQSPYHVHAVCAFSWLVLLNIQPLLIRTGRLRLHRLVGFAGLILALLVSFTTVVLFACTFLERFNREPVFTLVYVLDLFLLPSFLFCLIQAVKNRKQWVSHANYVLLSAIMLLPPGVGRLIYGVFLMPFSLPQRYFFEPMMVFTLGVLVYLGYRERWQQKQTLIIIAGLSAAMVLAYLVTYGIY